MYQGANQIEYILRKKIKVYKRQIEKFIVE